MPAELVPRLQTLHIAKVRDAASLTGSWFHLLGSLEVGRWPLWCRARWVTLYLTGKLFSFSQAVGCDDHTSSSWRRRGVCVDFTTVKEDNQPWELQGPVSGQRDITVYLTHVHCVPNARHCSWGLGDGSEQNDQVTAPGPSGACGSQTIIQRIRSSNRKG